MVVDHLKKGFNLSQVLFLLDLFFYFKYTIVSGNEF